MNDERNKIMLFIFGFFNNQSYEICDVHFEQIDNNSYEFSDSPSRTSILQIGRICKGNLDEKTELNKFRQLEKLT